MGLDTKDKEMLSISIPVVDYWELKDELERLSETVGQLRDILSCFVQLYRQERVKAWEMVLTKLLEKEDKKTKRRRDDSHR
jgi:hypothetical protein